MNSHIGRREDKCIFVVPLLFGFSGDAVNERQLAKAIKRFCDVHAYSLAPLLQFLRNIRNKVEFTKLRQETGFRFAVPGVFFPYILGFFSTLIAGLLIAIIASVKKPRFIYIRSSQLALPFIWLKRLHKAKIVVKIPAIIEDELKNQGVFRYHPIELKITRFLIPRIDRYVFYHADVIAVPSPLMFYEFCRRRLVSPKKRVVYVPAGVDFDKIRKIKENYVKEHGRREGNSFVVGFVGSLAWWQGVDILVRAVNIFEKRGNVKVKLMIVGDGPLRGYISTLCNKLNVNCVITGFIPHEEALKKMAELDVLVLPRPRFSSTETVIPIKVIEAWALGVPVIMTRHKVLEFIGTRDHEHLIMCEPDPYDVADKIEYLLHSKEIREKIAKNGVTLAKNFDYSFIAKKLLEAVLDGGAGW